MSYLDAETARQIGFTAIWDRIQPRSELGRRRKRQTDPFLPGEEHLLRRELDSVEQVCRRLKQNPGAAQVLCHLLAGGRDLSGSLQQSWQGAALDDIELYEFKKLLLTAERVNSELAELQWETILPQSLPDYSSCLQALSTGQGSRDSFYLADSYDPVLAHWRQQRVQAEQQLAQYRGEVEARIYEACGRMLTDGDEVSVARTDTDAVQRLQKFPELAAGRRTDTAVTFRLAETETTQQLQQQLSHAYAQEDAAKHRVRAVLTAVIHEHSQEIRLVMELLGYLDFLLAKAEFCLAIGAVKPHLSAGAGLYVDEGRHILVQEDVEAQGLAYTPISVSLQSGVTVITGPNMGGKTVSLKTLGCLAAMAQHGLLVPARNMRFGAFRFVAAQFRSAEVPSGLSSFAAEIVFLRNVFPAASHRGLVLVDEIASGTNPDEGCSIARAVIEKLVKLPSVTVITTHYPVLAGLPGIVHLRVRGLDDERLYLYRQALADENITCLNRCMDYRLEKPDSPKTIHSDAVRVASALGFNGAVLKRALQLLAEEFGAEGRDRVHGK